MKKTNILFLFTYLFKMNIYLNFMDDSFRFKDKGNSCSLQ